MDIATFVDVAKALPTNISVLIRGNHGIGKSEVVHQIARDLGLELIDRRMSQLTEGDIVGLPLLEDGCTRFIPAEFIKIACSRPVMLFLDEINRATQEVMQACFQICLDRELNGNKLHPGTRVFAAVNSSAQYQVNEMDPAFLDRFFAIDLTPTPQDFFAWAETAGQIEPDLIRFLKERESRLEPSDANPGTVQPSRRSWARLDRTYKANKVYDLPIGESEAAKGRAYSMAIGFVGTEASIELCDFLSKRETRFTAVQILSEYPQHRAKVNKLGQDKLNTLIDMIVDHAKVALLTTQDADNLALFVQDLPGELRVSFITNYTKGTRPTPNFSVNFRTVNATVMPHIVAVFNDKKEVEKMAEAAKLKAEKAAAEEAAKTEKPAKKSKK